MVSDRVTERLQTYEFPLSVAHVARQIRAVAVQLKVDAGNVVSPRSELHVAALLVERKPRDVDLTRAQEDPRRHPQTEVRGHRSRVRYLGQGDPKRGTDTTDLAWGSRSTVKGQIFGSG